MSYLRGLAVLTLYVLCLASLTTGEESEPGRTAWAGDELSVSWPLPALHPPAVDTVVVDGVSQGHLLSRRSDFYTRNF